MSVATTAVATGTESTSADSARYLTFTLNGEVYALSIFNVSEILEHRHLTVVPMMPDFIRGVINLRGRAVPVIDLAIRFTGGTTAIARRTCIVIVHVNGPTPEDGGQDIGILVDAVNKVADFAPEDIEPPPTFGAGIRADYISGMARSGNAVNDDFIIVLDIDQVLSLADLANLGAAGRVPVAS